MRRPLSARRLRVSLGLGVFWASVGATAWAAPGDDAAAAAAPPAQTAPSGASDALPAGATPNGVPAGEGAGARALGGSEGEPAADAPAPDGEDAPRGGASAKASGWRRGGPGGGAVGPDPELEALLAAEHVLFPEALVGVTPGWSWSTEGSGPVVWADGLPPAVGRLPVDRGVPTADASWLATLVMPDLPVRLDDRVVRYLKFYRDDPRGQAILRVWARKSGRFEPAVRARLARAGMPTDLVWLSLAESGHNPTIVSPAGAAGLWQFMPDTARGYGLRVDRWVDERLDPNRETDIALRYLSDLHLRFGNWELAMAAYNMGPGGLGRAMQKFNTNDFWELSAYEAGVPWETSLYVPKIVALAVAMNNRAAFGLDGVEPEPAEEFDVVRAAPGTPLGAIAAAADTDAATLTALNPQFLAERVPPAAGSAASSESWPVRVPRGAGVVATQKLSTLGSVAASFDPYVTRLGDTVDAIAAERGVSESRLRRLNQLGGNERLEAGTVLLVPREADAGTPAPPATESVVVVPPRPFHYPDRTRAFFEARPGDDLHALAQALGVTKSELIAWNGLDPSAHLADGMMLQVFVPREHDVSRVRLRSEQEVRILVAGSKPFFDYFEGLNGRRRITVRARAGEKLADVARRYRLSLGWVERINRMSRGTALHEGDEVIVYVSEDDAAAVEQGATELAPELGPIDAPESSALPGAERRASEAAPGASAAEPALPRAEDRARAALPAPGATRASDTAEKPREAAAQPRRAPKKAEEPRKAPKVAEESGKKPKAAEDAAKRGEKPAPSPSAGRASKPEAAAKPSQPPSAPSKDAQPAKPEPAKKRGAAPPETGVEKSDERAQPPAGAGASSPAPAKPKPSPTPAKQKPASETAKPKAAPAKAPAP